MLLISRGRAATRPRIKLQFIGHQRMRSDTNMILASPPSDIDRARGARRIVALFILLLN